MIVAVEIKVQTMMVMKIDFIRNSRPEVLCKKGVLKNFVRITGKHLCRNLFINKVASLASATLLNKILRNSCLPVNLAKFLKKPFYILKSISLTLIRLGFLKVVFSGGSI